MFDGLKRKMAASAGKSLLRSLATDKNTQTTITGLLAAVILAVPGLDLEQVIAGDPAQIARLIAAALVAVIGFLATKYKADGKTSLIGVVAGTLYASAGTLEAAITGTLIAAIGYFTNKPVTPEPPSLHRPGPPGEIPESNRPR